MEKLYELVEVAQVLRISHWKAYRYAADGIIPSLEFGQKRVVRHSDLSSICSVGLPAVEIEFRNWLKSRTAKPRLGIESAKVFLLDCLKDGPVNAKAVLDAATAEGFSASTLNRAKRDLCIESEKVGAPGDVEAVWRWKLKSSAGS